MVVGLDGRVVVGVDAERGQDARDLVVVGHRARQLVGLEPAVHRDHGVALLRQLEREQCADGAVADDRDVGLVFGDVVDGGVQGSGNRGGASIAPAVLSMRPGRPGYPEQVASELVTETVAASSSPEGGRQWRRRARTRARLLAAARELVAERGIDAVAMSDVSAAAEFAAGTIYNYFSTFEELAAALIRAEIDSFGDRLDRIAEDVEDPAEVYAASLRHLVRHAISDTLWGRFYVQLGVGHPLVHKVLGPRARRDLGRCVEQGRLPDIDLDLAVASTFGALSAIVDLVTSGPVRDDVASRYAEAMLRMVGLPADEAHEVANRPLSALGDPPSEEQG